MNTFPETVTYQKYNSQPEELDPGFFISRADALMLFEGSTASVAPELTGEKFMVVTAGKTLDFESLQERWTVTLMNANNGTTTLMSKRIWWEDNILVNRSEEHISDTVER